MTRAFAMFWVCLFSCCTSNAISDEKPSVRVDLVDGSRIVGDLSRSTLLGRTHYGRLEIPLGSVHRLSRLAAGQIKIDFINGDELTVTPEFERLHCTTLFGDVALKLECVTSVYVRSGVLETLPARDRVVVYYGFDHDDEGDIRNQAQDALHAKNLGAKWIRQGIAGGAIEFDGSARLEIPHDNRLCPRTFTFAAWVYPTVASANYEMLIAKTNASSWDGGYGVCRVSGDRKNVRFFINGYTQFFRSHPLPVREWTHLACVAHGEGLQFYVNGKPTEAGPSQNPPNPLAARVQHTTTPLTLGGDPSHYGWQGRMDEFVLFDRALSDKQIKQLYTTFAPR